MPFLKHTQSRDSALRPIQVRILPQPCSGHRRPWEWFELFPTFPEALAPGNPIISLGTAITCGISRAFQVQVGQELQVTLALLQTHPLLGSRAVSAAVRSQTAQAQSLIHFTWLFQAHLEHSPPASDCSFSTPNLTALKPADIWPLCHD